MLAGDAVEAAVFEQVGAGLMKCERHSALAALVVYVEHPVVVERAGIFTRLAPDRDFAYFCRVEISAYIHRPEHWGHNYQAVSYRQVEKYWQAVVGSVLILDRASYAHIVIALAPVGRKALAETVDAFGEKEETAIAATAYYVPYLGPPWVGLLNEQVGGETQCKFRPRRIFPLFASVELQRHVERAGAPHIARGCRCAKCGIFAIHVAVLASGTDFVAAVPRVPHRRHWHDTVFCGCVSGHPY